MNTDLLNLLQRHTSTYHGQDDLMEDGIDQDHDQREETSIML